MADIQYSSNGKGNLGVTLGAIGTGIGVLGNNWLNGVLGRGDPEDRPVSRYEMGLIQGSMAKDSEIAMLKSQMYTDNKTSVQAVWNATQEAQIAAQQKQIDQLYTLTQLVVPNTSVMPGWGAVTIKPTA